MKVSTKKNWDDFWTQKSNLAEVYPNTDRIRENIRECTSVSGLRILEVGAGTGRDSFYMARDGATLFLLDYSMPSLQLIKKAAPHRDRIHIIGGDAFSLPFPDKSLDIVFHQGLLEHFTKNRAQDMLKEHARVLKPGGLLVVDVPQRWHVYTVIKHILIALNAWFAGWEREFSVRELKIMLQHEGLDPIYSYGEWMYPSLVYRMTREAFAKLGVRLPLYPPTIPLLTTIRSGVRKTLKRTWLQKNTALSIGVVGRKS